MNVCPACSKTIRADDLTCPHCGISLNPGTATSGRAGGTGKGLSVVAMVVVGLVGVIMVVVVLGCLGAVAVPFFMVARPVPPLPKTAPLPMIAPPIVETARSPITIQDSDMAETQPEPTSDDQPAPVKNGDHQ